MASAPNDGSRGSCLGKILSDQAWEMARYGGDFPISKGSTIDVVVLMSLNARILNLHSSRNYSCGSNLALEVKMPVRFIDMLR